MAFINPKINRQKPKEGYPCLKCGRKGTTMYEEIAGEMIEICVYCKTHTREWD